MKAALDAIGEGCSAAFHAYHPCFLLGQESVAWEIWEQLSGELPNWYVVPIGQGVHLLGAWLGFQKLVDAGLADQVPRLVGVQPSRLPPICEAFEADLEDIASMDADQLSVAEGLAITQPVRSRRILQAIRESEGICVQVSEDEIMDAHKTLSTHGFFVEPTSATALAALSELVKHAVPQDRIVLPLTGTGLKGMPNI